MPSVSAPAPPDAPRSPAADPTSPEAAADVVRAYYRDLNRRAYESAFERWGPDGPPDQTYDAFVTGFAETASVSASVGEPSALEGAAGSVYVTVPTVVTAETTGGAEQRFEGTYVLRRVNDVPGAQPWQLRWHIEGADLREVAGT